MPPHLFHHHLRSLRLQLQRLHRHLRRLQPLQRRHQLHRRRLQPGRAAARQLLDWRCRVPERGGVEGGSGDGCGIVELVNAEERELGNVNVFFNSLCAFVCWERHSLVLLCHDGGEPQQRHQAWRLTAFYCAGKGTGNHI